MKWKKVNEELPDRDDKFLVFDESLGMITLWFNAYHNCWDDVEGDDYYCDSVGGKITHWMELPDNPHKKYKDF